MGEGSLYLEAIYLTGSLSQSSHMGVMRDDEGKKIVCIVEIEIKALVLVLIQLTVLLPSIGRRADDTEGANASGQRKRLMGLMDRFPNRRFHRPFFSFPSFRYASNPRPSGLPFLGEFHQPRVIPVSKAFGWVMRFPEVQMP